MTADPRRDAALLCECCGQRVTVYSADEGTQSYVGAERATLLDDLAAKVAAVPDKFHGHPLYGDVVDRAAVLRLIEEQRHG